jgi:hypothetical protein
VEEKLSLTFSQMKKEDIKDLEHHSNRNFYTYGVENIGVNLQQELIKMNPDGCLFRVRKDCFYFFQDKVIFISNHQKCLKVTVSCDFLGSLFRIRGFQNSN